MKRLKTIILGMLLIGASNISFAQSSLTVEASQNITNFIFFNSDGVKDSEYNPIYSGGYAIGYRKMLDNGLIFQGKLGMRNGGATYIFDATNYSWNLKYAEVRLGLGYNYSFGKIGAHLIAQPYMGFLLKANQRLNNENFDITKDGSINTKDFGAIVSPGANFSVSDNISVYLDINYMIGLANLETDGAQISKNSLMGATLGVAFTIE